MLCNRPGRWICRADRIEDNAGNLLQDGEPLVKGQLMQIQREWQELPAVRARACPTCPLLFTSQDLLAQETEETKWIQGLELMNQVLESLGTVDRGWHGWVKAEDYALFKENWTMFVKNSWINYQRLKRTDTNSDS